MFLVVILLWDVKSAVICNAISLNKFHIDGVRVGPFDSAQPVAKELDPNATPFGNLQTFFLSWQRDMVTQSPLSLSLSQCHSSLWSIRLPL